MTRTFEVRRVPLTPTAQAALVLMAQTGGWALPERGKMWRGADGRRFLVNHRPLTGTIEFTRMVERGLIEKYRAPDDVSTPVWLSRGRTAYRMLKAGADEARRYLPEKRDDEKTETPATEAG